MKKLTTLAKEIEKMENEQKLAFLRGHLTLDEAIEYYSVDEDALQDLTANILFTMLIFDEIKKAVDKKDKFTLELDANIEFSKMHDSDKYLLDYFSLLDSDNKRAIQIYTSCNAKKQTATFHLCTSCRKTTRQQFEQLEDELQYIVKYDNKTQRAKTSERKQVKYDELVDVIKTTLAVLNNEYQPAEADEQKAEE